jgi:hypothetical protein
MIKVPKPPNCSNKDFPNGMHLRLDGLPRQIGLRALCLLSGWDGLGT